MCNQKQQLQLQQQLLTKSHQIIKRLLNQNQNQKKKTKSTPILTRLPARPPVNLSTNQFTRLPICPPR